MPIPVGEYVAFCPPPCGAPLKIGLLIVTEVTDPALELACVDTPNWSTGLGVGLTGVVLEVDAVGHSLRSIGGERMSLIIIAGEHVDVGVGRRCARETRRGRAVAGSHDQAVAGSCVG